MAVVDALFILVGITGAALGPGLHCRRLLQTHGLPGVEEPAGLWNFSTAALWLNRGIIGRQHTFYNIRECKKKGVFCPVHIKMRTKNALHFLRQNLPCKRINASILKSMIFARMEMILVMSDTPPNEHRLMKMELKCHINHQHPVKSHELYCRSLRDSHPKRSICQINTMIDGRWVKRFPSTCLSSVIPYSAGWRAEKKKTFFFFF